MAVLCQQIEPRADGSVDVLGIVDGVVVEPEADDPLGLKPAANIALTALLSVRAGDLRGSHTLALQAFYPSGTAGPATERLVEFTDSNPAASLVVPLDLHIHEPGVYTFDATCDARLLTRMSLWVTYRRAPR
jgi:hypothetical protein